jgi:cytoskeletal protein CcmA (bactofilin family)
MFSSSKNTQVSSSKVETVVGQGTCIDGDIKSTGIVRVDGKCTGDVVTNADVIIGECGCIDGNVTAVNVSIAGKIEGNVRCTGVLEIMLKGTLVGDVEVTELSIQKGAIFNGKCNIISNEVDKLVAADITV